MTPKTPGSKNAADESAGTPIPRSSREAARSAARNRRQRIHQEAKRIPNPIAHAAPSISGSESVIDLCGGRAAAKLRGRNEGFVDLCDDERDCSGRGLAALVRQSKMAAEGH